MEATRFRVNQLVAGLAVTLACLALSARAAESDPSAEARASIRTANAKCLECHVVAALQNPPRDDLDLKKLRRVILDVHAYAGSAHGKLACTKCHTEGYEKQPHAVDANQMTTGCEDCHSKRTRRIEPEFEKSVHARNLGEIITCLTCHDPHTMLGLKDQTKPDRIVAQQNRVCLGCHDSDETFARYAPEKKARPAIDDIHSWLPNARLHWKAVRCVECHTPLSPDKDVPSHEIVKRDRAEKKCVTCHSADSALKDRLYRYLSQEEQRKYGFLNSTILGNTYMISATRNTVMDGIVIALMALTLAGVLIHGLLRYIAYRLRGRKRHD